MKKHLSGRVSLLVCLGLWLLSACSSRRQEAGSGKGNAETTWPHAVTYEIFVQSFYDADGDGIGDIRGMTSRLDYIQDLGVEAVWLMPIGPSPSYHKYDVTDYRGIHPDYGTMEDFKNFVEEAHQRDINVVIDLVVNHTSSEHPWFQAAVKDKNSPYRDYYVWAYGDSIKEQIAKKEVTLDSDNITQWHQAEGNEQLYYGFFYGGMPDLNFDNPEVREEVKDIGRFWLEEVGVDGFRLDAARHIFPDDRPEDNHQWWVEFRKAMEQVRPDVYLVGEVWADARTVAPYMKGLHALFNFDLGYAITHTVRNEEGTDVVQMHKKIIDFYRSVNPDFIDATFITNHDQNRIMSEVNSNVNQAKMAVALLMTLPGAPYIYYGEEIGMRGKKPDEHIREPFVWDAEGKDPGQPTWIEPVYSTSDKVTPLAEQKDDSNSMYNHYRKLIAFRESSPALTFGDIDTTGMDARELSSFYRSYEGEEVLVLHNLSGQALSVPQVEKSGTFKKKAFGTKDGLSIEEDRITLPPYSSFVLEK